MSLTCTSALAVCLNYMGKKIPDEDVFVIRYYCEELMSFPAHTFLQNSADHRGYINADELERLGLVFRWKPTDGANNEWHLAAFRQKELLRACVEFNRIADVPENWGQ